MSVIKANTSVSVYLLDSIEKAFLVKEQYLKKKKKKKAASVNSSHSQDRERQPVLMQYQDKRTTDG